MATAIVPGLRKPAAKRGERKLLLVAERKSHRAAASLKSQANNVRKLQAAALKCWQTDEEGAERLGHALVAVREAMKKLGRGKFTEWYRHHKMDENRVQYCIRKVEGKIKPKFWNLPSATLPEQYVAAPFSILEAQSPEWMARKKQWRAFGADCGHVRQLNEAHPQCSDAFARVSKFDPVLAEFVYRSYAPTNDNGGASVLDPFAGTAVKGIVASALGCDYTGCELEADQIKANQRDFRAAAKKGVALDGSKLSPPNWVKGNSENLDTLLPAGKKYDLVFTCPPYFDLELYSREKKNLSASASYEEFMLQYEKIFCQAAARLKQNRFLIVVVGEVRDEKTGFCWNFVGDNTVLFRRLGLKLYNHAILATSKGTAGSRAAQQFPNNRKLVSVHQHVLVFFKGENDESIPSQLGRIPKLVSPKPYPWVIRTTTEPRNGAPAPETPVTDSAALTPVEKYGNIFVKRDDLFTVAGVRGGKARTCLFLAQGATGLVTAGARSSPQINIVAHIAQHLGIPARCHAPEGELPAELIDAQSCGCEIIQHKAGHNSVIVARAREDAKARGWKEIPFGMECKEAIEHTRAQVRNLPSDVRRIVMPVGSGMSLAGVLWGLQDIGRAIPVVGVVVGASPLERLDTYAPSDWRQRVTLVESGSDYREAAAATFNGILLDPYYEAKAVHQGMVGGDLFWIVGVRRSVADQIDRHFPATP